MRVLLLAVVLALAPLCLGQQDPIGAHRVLISVGKKDPKPLTPADFTVKCGKEVAQATMLEPASPFSFVIALDASNSGRDVFEAQRAGALQLLRDLLPENPGAVLTFGSAVEDRTQLTSDRAEAAQVVNHARPGGGSAIFDALVIALDTLKTAPREQPRLVFLFTDGDDNQSRVGREKAIDFLVREHITVFAFSASRYGHFYGRGEQNLYDIAEATGGEVIYATEDPKDMAKTIRRQLEKLKALQWLTFSAPPKAKGDLKVKVEGMKVTAPKHCLP